MIKVVALSSYFKKEQREQELFNGWSLVKFKNHLYAFGNGNLYSLQVDSKKFKWNKITSKGNPSPRTYHTCILYEKMLIIFGGINEQTKKVYNEMHSFDLINNSWKKIEQKNPIAPAYGHVATLIPNTDEMLVFGGNQSSKTYVFNFKSLEWNTLEPVKTKTKSKRSSDILEEIISPPARLFHSGCSSGDEFMIFGGKDEKTIYGDLWSFNYSSRKWKEISIKGTSSPRYGHLSFPYDNKIGIYGGTSDSNVELNTFIRLINKDVNQMVLIDGFFVDLDQDLFNNLGDVSHSCSWLEDSFFYVLGEPNETVLKAQSKKLKVFPPEYSKMKNLQAVYLKGNEISKVPKDLNVQILNLSTNHFTEFPVFNYSNLTMLDLSYNKISKITSLVAPNLQKLDLYLNQIKEIKKMHTPNLTYLDLSGSLLTTLPESIGSCPLQILHLEFNPISNLKFLAGKALSTLEVVYLEKNNFTEFPPELFEMKNLKTLLFKDCQTEFIPKEIQNLVNLETLAIPNNRIKVIPKEIMNLKNILEINISYNNIDEIPEELCSLKSLKELYLHHNHLSSIPKGFHNLTSLQTLILSHNEFTQIPPVFELRALRVFSMERNKIKEIPPDIQFLQNLEKLYLDKNQIEYIPLELIKCRQIKRLYISENNLKDLPVELGKLSQLRQFTCAYNYQINSRFLGIQSNQIKSIIQKEYIVHEIFIFGNLMLEKTSPNVDFHFK